MNATRTGQRVMLEASGGRAYLVGTVVEKPGRFYSDRPGWAWVDWGGGAAPSHVQVGELAPAPRQHHGHPFVGIEVDDAGEQRCVTCHVSLWRYDWSEPVRVLPAKAV